MAYSPDDVARAEYHRKQRQRAADNAVDSRPAIERLYSAYRDLISQGWLEALYAPKDGTEIEVIELGSTGIHKVTWSSFGHKPLDSCGSFFGAQKVIHHRPSFGAFLRNRKGE